MYNAQKPNLDDLPSRAKLFRSTLIAAGAAAVILVTVVWPAEYGVDPTGVGGVLGLTEMGQIKTQLHEEAEADRLMLEGAPQSSLGLIDRLFAGLVGAAHAQTAIVWKDEVTFDLAPSEGIEIKLVMEAGAKADFNWQVTGGMVNYDLHGDGTGNQISYEKGRGADAQSGVLTAEFTGNHGWFWRNRGTAPVSITLQVAGDYSAIKR